MSRKPPKKLQAVVTVERVNGFREWLKGRVLGQPEVIPAFDRHLGRSELGLTDPTLVKGAFLFVGPTGVGKTELVTSFAEYFHGKDSLLKLNMSEFKDVDQVREIRERLVKGKAAGKKVFLWDELEKAHAEAMDLLLQILDAGAEISDMDGEPVSFTDSYIFGTSNLGAPEAMRSRTRNYTAYCNTVVEYVQRHLRPELLGRIRRGIGSVLVFQRLGEPEQRAVAELHVRKVLARLEGHGHSLKLEPAAFEHIMRNGFSEQYGARNIVGVICDRLEGAVSHALRTGKGTSGSVAVRADGLGLEIAALAAIGA